MTNLSEKFCFDLAEKSLSNVPISKADARRVLNDNEIALIDILQAGFKVRRAHFNNMVSIHIINNAKNGNCPEDCAYCVQAASSDSPISDYPIKSQAEILAEAKDAYEKGAYRYCMVFSGRGPSKGRVKKIAAIIREIKEKYPIQVCLSPGLIDESDAYTLKAAGLDRLNHNLNTSERFYEKICTTHGYQDRLNTLNYAKNVGLETCSGIIVGMGESSEDVVEVAYKLKDLNTPSIPVNFYMALDGAPLKDTLNGKSQLTPNYCLRVLSLMRFVNPSAEIRMAAGREIHLRSMQVMGLYPANSLFMEGYLNTVGTKIHDTLQMIKDGGFEIQSDKMLENLQASERINMKLKSETDHSEPPIFKDLSLLRPTLVSDS